MKIPFEEFKKACWDAMSSQPTCTGWQMTFDERDFQREWYASAFSGQYSATVVVSSANTTSATGEDVVGQLIKVIRELEAENLGR